MIYVLSKNDYKFLGCYDSLKQASDFIAAKNISEDDCIFTEDIGVKYISRITFVDGECVYKNKNWWTTTAPTLLTNYDEHTVIDILGEPVSLDRFERELRVNVNAVNSIDGRPGEIAYDMQVGSEFVSLFREECILTKFTNESDTSPMIIFQKLATVIEMLAAGAFREAKQYLVGYRAQLKDDFLTDERLDKYIAMLDSADAIEYATDEDYFYIVPGEK